MLPKKEKKKATVTRKPHKKHAVFDQGKPLKQAKIAAKKKQTALYGSIFRGLALFFILSCIISGGYSFLKVRAFDSALEQTIMQLEGSCKDYSLTKSLNAVLLVTIDQTNTLKKAEYVVYDEEKKYAIDFTGITFAIDKGGTQGTLKDYIKANNIFLEEEKILGNLSNLFLREFYLKVDHIVVSRDGFGVTDFIAKRRMTVVTKLRDLNKPITHTIKTDICRNSWTAFIEDLISEKRVTKQINYSDKTRITDLFFFGDLRKEQIRIHINNRTGVDHWGRYLTRLFESYGLNVVKIDNDITSSPKSKIYIDDNSLRNSATLQQIGYLINNMNENPLIENKGSIYSDIDIEVGQDLLIP
jgi:hypothetical protein